MAAANSIQARKAREGRDHVQAADNFLETSVWKLKFSPDWDSAANELTKAAICFKVAMCWDECKAAHLRACEAYANSGSLYHAAKQLDQALLVCKEQNKLEEVEDLASRGGLLYRQGGNPESAAQMLVRAAKMLEREFPVRAMSLYEKASDTVSTEDRMSEAGQHLEKAAMLAVRCQQLDKAADLLHTTLGLYSEAGAGGNQHGRLVLAFMVVQLQRGDCVAASKVWSQWGGWCDGQQAAAADDILQGFQGQDRELAQRGLNSGAVKSLDIDYAKMARDMQLPPEDDEEGGLC